MKARHRSPAIRRMKEKARSLGYTVEFVEFVHLAGILEMVPGQIAGACDYDGQRIIVSTMQSFNRPRPRREIEAILSHELEHAGGAEVGTDYPEHKLRCGGRINAAGVPL